VSFLYNNLWVAFIHFNLVLMPAYLRHRLQSFFSGLLLEFLFLFLLQREFFYLFLLFLGSPFTVSIPTTDLPFIISTPAVNEAIFRSCDGVMLSTSNLNDVVPFERIKVFHSSWNRCIMFSSDSKLAPVVQTPSENLVLVVDVERVLISTEDIDSALCSHFLNDKGLLVSVSCFQISANFARFSVTPSVDFATS